MEEIPYGCPRHFRKLDHFGARREMDTRWPRKVVSVRARARMVLIPEEGVSSWSGEQHVR